MSEGRVITLADLTTGDFVCQNGFVQRVKSVESGPMLIWDRWMYVELEPPEVWLKPGWSLGLTGPPDMRIVVRRSTRTAA